MKEDVIDIGLNTDNLDTIIDMALNDRNKLYLLEGEWRYFHCYIDYIITGKIIYDTNINSWRYI